MRHLRGAGCAFALLLLLSAIGATALIRFVAGGNEWATVAVPLVMLIVVAIVFMTVRRSFGSPMSDIIAAADRVGEGDYSTQLSERGPPWLRSVSRAFNSMTARLHANERQRRNMMADIAHELRTPLTVIQGRLEALIDGVYPRDDAKLEELLEETRVLSRLVEDLRTLANAEAGALALQKEPTDLVELLQGLSFELHFSLLLPPVEKVKSEALTPDIDPVRIREVLMNLIENAKRHGGDGNVTVRVEPGDGDIRISVSDTGPGIAPEDLPHIFDRFYKGSGSQGSGLGLTIVRNLVEAHGGTIRAESTPGKGTTIVFTLQHNDLERGIERE